MKPINKKGGLFFILLGFWILGVQAPPLQAMGTKQGENPPKTQIQKSAPGASDNIQVIVPIGTSVKVQLNQSIRIATHRSGQSFFATLKEPIRVGSQTLVSEGIPLIGVISRSVESGHFAGRALIELRLVRIMMPDEKIYPLETEPFRKTGRAHSLRNLGLIGVGAIVGAGLGNLLGQIPGALLGLGFGGGIGAVMAYVTGKEDLFIKTGSELVFKLARPLPLSFQAPSSISSK